MVAIQSIAYSARLVSLYSVLIVLQSVKSKTNHEFFAYKLSRNTALEFTLQFWFCAFTVNVLLRHATTGSIFCAMQ